jgi:hypothetical protein
VRRLWRKYQRDFPAIRQCAFECGWNVLSRLYVPFVEEYAEGPPVPSLLFYTSSEIPDPRFISPIVADEDIELEIVQTDAPS